MANTGGNVISYDYYPSGCVPDYGRRDSYSVKCQGSSVTISFFKGDTECLGNATNANFFQWTRAQMCYGFAGYGRVAIGNGIFTCPVKEAETVPTAVIVGAVVGAVVGTVAATAVAVTVAGAGAGAGGGTHKRT